MKILNQIRYLCDEYPMMMGCSLFVIFLLLLFFYYDSPVFWGGAICFSAVAGLVKHHSQ